MNESRQKRIEKPKSCQADPDAVNDNRSDEVLHDRATAAARNANRFSELGKI